MKNALEGIAVGLVVLLTFGLIGLIVQYNMIDTEETVYDSKTKQSLESETAITAKKESKVSSYLDKLEGYEDVDTKVAPDAETEEDTTNVTVVEAEVGKEDITEDIGKTVQAAEKGEKIEPKKTMDKEKVNKDPVGDIVNDIDSIINASESK